MRASCGFAVGPRPCCSSPASLPARGARRRSSGQDRRASRTPSATSSSRQIAALESGAPLPHPHNGRRHHAKRSKPPAFPKRSGEWRCPARRLGHLRAPGRLGRYAAAIDRQPRGPLRQPHRPGRPAVLSTWPIPSACRCRSLRSTPKAKSSTESGFRSRPLPAAKAKSPSPLPEEPVVVGQQWTTPHDIELPLPRGGIRKIKARQCSSCWR